MRVSRSEADSAATMRRISSRRRSVTLSTSRRPRSASSRRTSRRSPPSRRREMSRLSTRRSHSRVAVDGSTPSASARSTGRWAPRDARMIKARYWWSDTSLSCSPSDLAATAMRVRLAVNTASVRSSTPSGRVLALIQSLYKYNLLPRDDGLSHRERPGEKTGTSDRLFTRRPLCCRSATGIARSTELGVGADHGGPRNAP